MTRSSGSKRLFAALALGTLAAVLPVTIRNRVVGKDIVPIAWQDGGNFYIGNNPESNGTTAVIPGTRADWWGGFDDWRRIAIEDEGRGLQPSEISRYWYRRGFDFLAHDPGAATRLYVRKLQLLLGNGEASNQEQMYFERNRSAVLSRLPVNFAMILALSAFGLVWLLRVRDRRALIMHAMAATYALSVLIFFVSSRHRLPFAVFLIPGAAVRLRGAHGHVPKEGMASIVPSRDAGRRCACGLDGESAQCGSAGAITRILFARSRLQAGWQLASGLEGYERIHRARRPLRTRMGHAGKGPRRNGELKGGAT